jgi:hypothetical protein
MRLFARLFARDPHRARGARWPENWAVYPGEANDEMAMYLVDLGAVEAAPIAELPVRLDVSIRFAARDDGMPAAGALPGVQRLEDVVSAETRRYGGAYVGRVISGGICHYTGYLPVVPDRPLALPRDDYAPIVSYYDDPKWSHLREQLAPDTWQRHVISDLLVVRALMEHGDGLDRDRPVEHVASFTEPRSAQAAAAELRVDGFDVTVGPGRRGDSLLEAVRQDPVAPPRVHALTWSVREVVDRYGGEYDGWGCVATP